MSKTLFVSDLDGTLLNQDQALSEYTRETLNRLIREGLFFTYATARSLTTAREVTEGLDLKLPVIVYNGAFVKDSASGESVIARQFSLNEKEDILAQHLTYGVYPRVYALHDGEEKFSYVKDHLSQGTKAYLDKRRGDKRARATTEDELLEGEVFCFSSIDDYEKLFPLYDALKATYHAVLYRDPYTSDYWLEILPKFATKADAVFALKALYGFERVVVFGDEKNDLSMFSLADECYAVANANEDVKHAASGVIASNDADGVAEYLLSRYNQHCDTK